MHCYFAETGLPYCGHTYRPGHSEFSLNRSSSVVTLTALLKASLCVLYLLQLVRSLLFRLGLVIDRFLFMTWTGPYQLLSFLEMNSSESKNATGLSLVLYLHLCSRCETHDLKLLGVEHIACINGSSFLHFY